MTITDAPPAALPLGDDPTTGPTGKECSTKGCSNRIPAHGEDGFSPARTKCDVHFGKHRTRSEQDEKARKDGTVSVDVNLGGRTGGKTAEDRRAGKVAKGATQMAQTLGTMLAVSGDKVCGAAIIEGADAWGEALGNLSRYQPWLEKVFAPTGELTGQGLAWIAVVAASAGIIVPVLAHHNLVSPALAQKMGGTLVATTQLGGLVDDSGPAAEPDAA